jgi:Phycobilisome protein
MTFQLSDRAKELIPKARIVSFTAWNQLYPIDTIARLQAADDAGKYLTDEELAVLNADETNSAKVLRDRADEIVTAARQQVLTQFPGITEPGGDLYPEIRAQSCWRDFWHFLRCVTYGIAGRNSQFLSTEGLHYMNLLYQELHVPLAAMVVGLEALKTESLTRIESEKSEEIALYFDRLIDRMKEFT